MGGDSQQGELFEKHGCEGEREVIVGMKAFRCLLEKLAAIIPCFESAQGGAHHDRRSVRFDGCEVVGTPELHGEELISAKELRRGVEK